MVEGSADEAFCFDNTRCEARGDRQTWRNARVGQRHRCKEVTDAFPGRFESIVSVQERRTDQWLDNISEHFCGQCLTSDA